MRKEDKKSQMRFVSILLAVTIFAFTVLALNPQLLFIDSFKHNQKVIIYHQKSDRKSLKRMKYIRKVIK